jgi:hypothetical protein
VAGAAEAAAEGNNVEPPDVWTMASATIETPTALPLEQRVAMHLAGIDAALHRLLARAP